jgi:hypothetical protein
MHNTTVLLLKVGALADNYQTISNLAFGSHTAIILAIIAFSPRWIFCFEIKNERQ